MRAFSRTKILITLSVFLMTSGLSVVLNSQEDCGENCQQNQIEQACSKINSGILNQYSEIDSIYRDFADSFLNNLDSIKFDIKKFESIGVEIQKINIELEKVESRKNTLNNLYDQLTRNSQNIIGSCGDGDITLDTVKFTSDVDNFYQAKDMLVSSLLELRTEIEKI